jgi:hypothetical protein
MTTQGHMRVLVVAGPIELSVHPAQPLSGKQVLMGNSGLSLHITPEVAKQWLPVIAEIAGNSAPE